MKSQKQATDIAALAKARNPLLWVVTREEQRVESYLFNAAAAAKLVPYTWDVAAGICGMNGKPDNRYQGSQDPSAAFASIQSRADSNEQGLFVMRDLPVWLQGPAGAAPMRQLRNLARALPNASAFQCIVVLTPSSDIPPELQGHAVVVEWPLPDRDEVAAILDVMIRQYKLEEMLKNGARESAIDAAVGLSGEEVQACYSKSLVQSRTIDPALVSGEKKRIISKSRGLEWIEPLRDGLAAVGGLENLKTWLVSRSSAYTPQARAYGLPMPKGILLVGVPGGGKTLIGNAIASTWKCPFLKWDVNAGLSKFVGESGSNLRATIQTIEAMGRVVVLIDEIEKTLQGATSGSSDGGVSADTLGTLLSWMNDRTSSAFVIATANDVSALPPELLRAGRFDCVWFVDLPNATERASVLQAALRKRNRTLDDVSALVPATEGFSGAEIDSIVPDAMYTAFADNGRAITVADLVEAAKNVVPLSRTAGEKMASLRQWAKGRARYATAPETESDAPRLRVLDIG